MRYLVSVIGGHNCDSDTVYLAEKIGGVIASEGAVLVCGGLGGVMEAACMGARKTGGMTLGIIPGEDKTDANGYVDIVITTGMGYSRNTLVAGTSDMVVALSGSYGTLSEIGVALNSGKPVYGMSSWEIEGVVPLDGPEDLRNIIRDGMRGQNKEG